MITAITSPSPSHHNRHLSSAPFLSALLLPIPLPTPLPLPPEPPPLNQELYPIPSRPSPTTGLCGLCLNHGHYPGGAPGILGRPGQRQGTGQSPSHPRSMYLYLKSHHISSPKHFPNPEPPPDLTLTLTLAGIRGQRGVRLRDVFGARAHARPATARPACTQTRYD